MNILRIALNDIRVVLKDRMIILWWLAMPLAFVFMFSFMVRDRTQASTWLAVFKLDDHEMADIFLDELRVDETRTGLSRDEALKAAPDAAEGHFRVPRSLPES